MDGWKKDGRDVGRGYRGRAMLVLKAMYFVFKLLCHSLTFISPLLGFYGPGKKHGRRLLPADEA